MFEVYQCVLKYIVYREAVLNVSTATLSPSPAAAYMPAVSHSSELGMVCAYPTPWSHRHMSTIDPCSGVVYAELCSSTSSETVNQV